jgi:hypothetical protein
MTTSLIGRLQTLKAQQDRDGKVRDLWGVVLETLDFMKQAEPLKEIQGLEKTVQSIMKQIYDCTLFLRSYGERGFVGGCPPCWCYHTAHSSLLSTTSPDSTEHLYGGNG